MADESKKTLIISAENDTEEAINEAKANFASLHKEVQAQFHQNSRGVTTSIKDLEKLAKAHGTTMEAEIKHFDETAKALTKAQKAALAAGKAIADTGGAGGAALNPIADMAGEAAGALAAMAVKGLSVYEAFKLMQRGYLAFGDFDKKLRSLQNSIGGTRSEIESFGEMFNQVALKTGDDVGLVQTAFKTFLDKSHIPPDQAKKMFPDIAAYSKGAEADLNSYAKVVGNAMSIMSIPASDYKAVLEATVHAAGELNVSMEELSGTNGARAMESMAALGYHGKKGFAELATYAGVANRSTSDTGDSLMIISNIMEKMIRGDAGMAKALNMPVGVMLKQLEEAKEMGNPLAWIMNQFAKSNRQHEIMQAAGYKNVRVIREFQRSIMDMGDEVDKTNNAMGGLAKSQNMMEGPNAAVGRLTVSLSLLIKEIGHLLDAFGVTWVIQKFATILGGIATTAERLISLFESLKRFEMPPWWPKTKAELGSNMLDYGIGVAKTVGTVIPHVGVAGRLAEAARDRYAPGSKVEEGPPLSTEAVRPYENVPLTSGAPGNYQQNYSVGQRPGGAVKEKINYRSGGTSGSTEFSARRRNPNIQNAAMVSDGDNASKIAKAIAKESGGGYGSSTDAKYLQASYHPGGGVGAVGGKFGSSGLNTGVYDQAGPQGANAGTGYGGGTDLAPPAPSGPRDRTDSSTTSSQAPASTQAPGQQAPTTTTTGQPGGTATGDYQGKRVNADVMKTRIQQANAEWMKDPKNQQMIYRTLQAEGGSNIGANLEQMSNYAASRNKTLEQVVNARGQRQFYGPLRRLRGDPGSGRLKKHERDAYYGPWTDAKQKAWDRASSDVFSKGSNRINYATDQGMEGDPNYNAKTMTNIGGNMFGVQPGTGKWVSAQRGKPQIDGPVSVAATAPAPAATPTETAMAPGEPGKFAFPEKKLDRSGREPEAMITHHTSGGPKETPQGIVNWWKQQGKGLGSQYIQDREGRIWDTAKELGWNKTAHAMPAGIYRGNTMTSRFPEGDPRRNLSNANTVGIEVMASNDKGVKEVQAREFAKFMAARYPKTQMFGHGEINVNRKEKDEGITVKNAAYAYRAQLAAKAKENSSVDLANARKDDTSLQASIDSQPKPKTRSFIPADDAHNKRMEEHRETTKALKGGGEAEAEAPKSRPSDDLIMASQRDVNVNLKVNDSSMQFARASMARQADVEMRKARQNSHGDIGVA